MDLFARGRGWAGTFLPVGKFGPGHCCPARVLEAAKCGECFNPRFRLRCIQNGRKPKKAEPRYLRPNAKRWPSCVTRNTFPKAITGSLKCTQFVMILSLDQRVLPVSASKAYSVRLLTGVDRNLDIAGEAISMIARG